MIKSHHQPFCMADLVLTMTTIWERLNYARHLGCVRSADVGSVKRKRSGNNDAGVCWNASPYSWLVVQHRWSLSWKAPVVGRCSISDFGGGQTACQFEIKSKSRFRAVCRQYWTLSSVRHVENEAKMETDLRCKPLQIKRENIQF